MVSPICRTNPGPSTVPWIDHEEHALRPLR
jgi:hypothetical protein